MDANSTDRMKSGRLAMRYLADSGVRDDLHRASVPLDAPVVVCEWETSMGEVMSMISRARAAAEVSPDHVLIVIRRGEAMQSIVASSQDVQVMGDYISSNEVHADSCVGHLYEALLPRKQWSFGAGMLNTRAPIEPAAVSIDGISFELV